MDVIVITSPKTRYQKNVTRFFGIGALDRKMTSFRLPENIIEL